MTWATRGATALASTPLVLALLVAPASAEGASGSAWGFDGVLRRGCRDYPYRYAISAPTGEWTLEVFLRDRDGRNLASGTFNSDSDHTERTARFRFCRYSTRPGRFTVRSLLHWYDVDGTGHGQWLDETRFRLRRPH